MTVKPSHTPRPTAGGAPSVPPARTAAFSRARRPGVVLRVSQTRSGAAASAKARVRVAIPLR